MEESVSYQLIKDEGRIEQARRTVAELGRAKFGSPNRLTLARIGRITDLRRLDHLAIRILGAKTWTELLAE